MPDQLGKKGEGFRRFFTAFTRLLCGRKLAVNPNCRTRQRGDDKSIETIVARRSIESDRNEIVGVGGAVRALERELVPLLFLRDSSTTKFSENNLSLVFSYFSSYSRTERWKDSECVSSETKKGTDERTKSSYCQFTLAAIFLSLAPFRC